MEKDITLEKVSFESAMAELERLVNAADSGDIALEEAVEAYQRGIALVQHCHAKLERAQEQIKALDETLDTLSLTVSETRD